MPHSCEGRFLRLHRTRCNVRDCRPSCPGWCRSSSAALPRLMFHAHPFVMGCAVVFEMLSSAVHSTDCVVWEGAKKPASSEASSSAFCEARIAIAMNSMHGYSALDMPKPTHSYKLAQAYMCAHAFPLLFMSKYITLKSMHTFDSNRMRGMQKSNTRKSGFLGNSACHTITRK